MTPTTNVAMSKHIQIGRDIKSNELVEVAVTIRNVEIGDDVVDTTTLDGKTGEIVPAVAFEQITPLGCGPGSFHIIELLREKRLTSWFRPATITRLIQMGMRTFAEPLRPGTHRQEAQLAAQDAMHAPRATQRRILEQNNLLVDRGHEFALNNLVRRSQKDDVELLHVLETPNDVAKTLNETTPETTPNRFQHTLRNAWPTDTKADPVFNALWDELAEATAADEALARLERASDAIAHALGALHDSGSGGGDTAIAAVRSVIEGTRR